MAPPSGVVDQSGAGPTFLQMPAPPPPPEPVAGLNYMSLIQPTFTQIDGAGHKDFNAACACMEKHLDPNVVDDRQQVAEQLAQDPSYRFGAVKDARGEVTGGLIYNHLEGQTSNFVFVNNCGTDNTEVARQLVSGMDQDARGAAGKPMALVWETSGNECAYADQSGFRTLDFNYIQPSVQPGKPPVALPLKLKITDEANPAWVRNDRGAIVGIKAENLKDVVDTLYRDVYEKVNGATTSPEMLGSMGSVVYFTNHAA